MIYIMSASLIASTVAICVLIELLRDVRKLEKEICESHITLSKVTRELDDKLTGQIAFVDETAKKSVQTVTTYAQRIEDLNNKIALIGMKR